MDLVLEAGPKKPIKKPKPKPKKLANGNYIFTNEDEDIQSLVEVFAYSEELDEFGKLKALPQPYVLENGFEFNVSNDGIVD